MLERLNISATSSGETLGVDCGQRVSPGRCAVASAVEPGRGRSFLGT
jgi:hypothetical protein